MTFITIDPGYDRVGWAVGTLVKKKLVPKKYGCITTDRNQTIFQRYHRIETELTAIIEEIQPEEMAIEALFFSRNTTTAIRVSEAKGIIISCALQHNLTISEYTPSEIKQAVTGNGKASKEAVDKMVRMQLNIHKEQKIIDDAMDAIALLLTHSASRNLAQKRTIAY